MDPNQNELRQKGHPLYFFLGTVPFIVVMAVNFIVSFASVFLYAIWLGLQGVNSYFEVMNRSMEFIMSHTMEFTILFQVPALLFAFLWYWFAYVRKKKLILEPAAFTVRQSLPLIVLLALGASQIVGLVLMLEGALLPAHMEAYEQLMETAGIGGNGIAVFVSTVILAPLMEETVFRGLTVQILKRTGWRFWIVNLIQAALFGLFHMNLIQGIYAFLIGLMLGYICEVYGSLKAAIALHAAFNICGSYLQTLLDKWLVHTETVLPNILLGAAGCAAAALAVRLILKEVGKKRQASA